MKIAIIGYGKMGIEIEKIAIERNHEITLKIDLDNSNDFNIENLQKADVAIEFTNPQNAYKNFLKCFEANIPVVSGTTGWLDKFEEIVETCKTKNKAFFYASNFSLGVNIFFKLNQYLSKIINKQEDFDISLSETHHIHKLDAPSGTAISLANDIIDNVERKKSWTKNALNPSELEIKSFREGEVFGVHQINFSSDTDEIEIKHSLKNRRALSLGAVIAAEFLCNKKGFYTMSDLLQGL